MASNLVAMMVAVSSTAGWFYLLAGVFLLYQIWRGWRMGLVRAALRLLAWVGSGVVGWYGGVLAAQAAANFFPAGRIFVGVVVGLSLALAVYLILTLLSVLFFKKTQDNSSTLLRWVYGVGGAFMGLCLGVVFLWAVVTGVRAVGGMQEGRQEAAGQASKGPLVEIKESMEGEGVTGWVSRLDPLPTGVYQTLNKFSRVTASPDAIIRLAEYPDIADLLQHPKFLALSQDRAIQDAAAQRNVLVILTHPRLLELATDPEIVSRVRQINLEAALDHALQEPHQEPR